MPIAKELKPHYKTEAWKWMSEFVRLRADNRCEICGVENRSPISVSGSPVVLTVMHLDHNPEESPKMSSLAAACQKCHNQYDAPVRAENRRRKLRIVIERFQLLIPCLKSVEISRAGNGVNSRQLEMKHFYQNKVNAANSALNIEYAAHSESQQRKEVTHGM